MSNRQVVEDYKRQSVPTLLSSEHSTMLSSWAPTPLSQEASIQPYNVVFHPEHPMIYHQPPQAQHEHFNTGYMHEQVYPPQPPQTPQEQYNVIYPQETFQEPYNVVFHPPEHFTAPYHSSPALNNSNYTPYTDEYSAEYPSTNDYLSHDYIPPPPPFQQQPSYQEQIYQQQQEQQQQQQESLREDEKKKNTDIKSEGKETLLKLILQVKY